MTSLRLLLAGLLAALVVAGGVSYYASGSPDGLEYVAEQVGFLDAAEDPATADGPLADYAVRGVEDDRVSGGLAGVLGVLVTFGVAGGGFWLLRRRGVRTG